MNANLKHVFLVPKRKVKMKTMKLTTTYTWKSTTFSPIIYFKTTNEGCIKVLKRLGEIYKYLKKTITSHT
jgi:hypothetical protein